MPGQLTLSAPRTVHVLLSRGAYIERETATFWQRERDGQPSAEQQWPNALFAADDHGSVLTALEVVREKRLRPDG